MHKVEKKDCIHCGQPMPLWAVSSHDYSDGLGFGTPVMRVCFNDECPFHVKGWNTMHDSYGRIGSVRFFFNPFDGDNGALPVAHKDAMRGDIIEEE
ncbi:MAG: hypothetical protein HQL52_00605 [Magnetococcales bacterium]|nr:hypothetical protein [Magnetococcales bacterium]